MKISIIVPMYNAEEYIERCIKSIKKQEYQNYEVIIIDDGSNDNSYDKCQRLIQHDSRFHLIHQENKGVSAARNIGIQKALGEWIYFLDSDDELKDHALIYMENRIQEKFDWIIMGIDMLDETTKEEIENPFFFEEDNYLGDKNDFPDLLMHKLFLYICGKLYKRKIIEENQLTFPIGIQYGEDVRFNLEYFSYVRHYIICKFYPYLYHIRQGEGLGSKYYDNHYEMEIDLIEKIQDTAQNVYHLGQSVQDRLQEYYYNQGINTAAAYINIWTHLSKKKRKQGIKKIMNHPQFQQNLEKEYKNGRVHEIDYFILKRKQFVLYYYIHYIYTYLKKFKRK